MPIYASYRLKHGMQRKKTLLVALLIVALATVSVVAADQAGIITINILNNQNSQLYTDISNSTVNGQTNYTNSNAVENIALNNSTLTIMVNGQNITITSQGDNLIISTANQTVTTNPNANSIPLLTVSFLRQGGNQHGLIAGNATYEYDFNVTVGVPTSMNFPWGKTVTHEAIGKTLAPLVDKYSLATRNDLQNGEVAVVAAWVNMQVAGGENRFSLFSNDNLTAQQIQSLTVDLYNAFSLAMSGDT